MGFLRSGLHAVHEITERQKIRLTSRIVEEMRRYTGDRDILLFLFYLRIPQPYTERYDAMSELAAREGIRWRMIPLVPEDRVHEIGHWSPGGHAMAADVIYQELMGDPRFRARAGIEPVEPGPSSSRSP